MTERVKAARKRARRVQAKPGQLLAAWGRGEVPGDHPDVQYAWGAGGAGRADARILSAAFEEAAIYGGKPLRAELEARGYDIATLRFSIEVKHPIAAARVERAGGDGACLTW